MSLIHNTFWGFDSQEDEKEKIEKGETKERLSLPTFVSLDGSTFISFKQELEFKFCK